MRNKCGTCQYSWCPRGHHFSAKCPRCGSSKIASDNDAWNYIATIAIVLAAFAYVIYLLKGW